MRSRAGSETLPGGTSVGGTAMEVKTTTSLRIRYPREWPRAARSWKHERPPADRRQGGGGLVVRHSQLVEKLLTIFRPKICSAGFARDNTSTASSRTGSR